MCVVAGAGPLAVAKALIMKRIFALTAVLTLSLLAAASAARGAHGCTLRGAHVLQQTPSAVLLVRHGSDGDLVYGCLRSKGAIYRLTHVQEPRVVTKIFSTRLRGRYAAYGELYYGPAGGDDIVLIRVRDLGTGRAIHSAQNGLSSQAQPIGSMVLKSTGSAAWTTRDYVNWYPPRPEELQVLALDGRLTDKLVRPRTLDRGAQIDLKSLRNGSGRSVSWLNGGARRSAELRR
jgi:hypothetical protein